MQVGFSVAVSCLHVLLTLFTPVRSEIKITNSSAHGIIVEENKPFTLWCAVTDSENGNVNGSFKWERDRDVSGGKTDVKDSDPDLNITEIKSEDGKSITSVVKVRKAPRIFGAIFYYTCKFEVTPKQSTSSDLPVTVLKVGTIPNITIVGNQTNSSVPLIVANFGEKVELICLVSYKKIDKNDATEVTLTLTWKKENGRTLDKKIFPKGKLSTMLESFPFKVTVNIRSSDDGGVYSCQSHYSYNKHLLNRTKSLELRIKPYVNEDNKEVKEVAGKDVQLKCDIVGYPLQYAWQFEDGTNITNKINSRYLVSPTVLAIKDITYDDRKKYICVGNYNNGEDTIKQTITLRVKDPLAPLWPFIGIILEIIVVVLIIMGTEYYKKKNTNKTDGGDESIDNDPVSTTYT